jgi:hypothetical protein
MEMTMMKMSVEQLMENWQVLAKQKQEDIDQIKVILRINEERRPQLEEEIVHLEQRVRSAENTNETSYFQKKLTDKQNVLQACIGSIAFLTEEIQASTTQLAKEKADMESFITFVTQNPNYRFGDFAVTCIG